jgi:hypothetical protein
MKHDKKLLADTAATVLSGLVVADAVAGMEGNSCGRYKDTTVMIAAAVDMAVELLDIVYKT